MSKAMFKKDMRQTNLEADTIHLMKYDVGHHFSGTNPNEVVSDILEIACGARPRDLSGLLMQGGLHH